MIIGILIAIALPTFLGARTRAQNRAAQSDLRNALVAAKTMYTDNSSYTCATATVAATGLPTVEPSLTYVRPVLPRPWQRRLRVSVAAAATDVGRSSDVGVGDVLRDLRRCGRRHSGRSTATAADCTGACASSAANTAATSWT